MIVNPRLPIRWLITLGLLLAMAACRTGYQAQNSQATLNNIDKALSDDASTSALIAPYKVAMERQMQDTLGYSEQLLDKEKADRRSPQSMLGNFSTDLLLTHGRNTLKQPIDFALGNAGGLRTTLPQGAITLGKVYEVMPFDNTVVTMQVTSAQVDSLVAMIVEGKDATYAGLKIRVGRDNKVQVWVGDAPLAPGKTYTLITSDYLASGGSNMSFLRATKQVNNTGIFMRDFIAGYIRAEHKAGRKVKSALDDRFIREQ